MSAAVRDDKVAVVTGASRGIGAALVHGFRTRGYAVVANSRSIQAVDDPEVTTIAGDVGDPDTADRIVERAMDRYGRVDTLVNNAGIFLPKPFGDYDEADLTSMIAVNLMGSFRLAQRAAAHMLKAGHGHIVTITASLATQPLSAVPASLAVLTKGGLDAVTRALALELAPSGVRVNAVAPGVIDTPMHVPEARGFLAGLQPVGRMGTTTDVVDAVLYLEGAPFVTGEILHVDGGTQAGR